MKIPIKIGEIISKDEIVICPDCEGEGVVFQFQERKELPAYLTCPLCKGKRVLQRVERVIYTRIGDNWQMRTAPAPYTHPVLTDTSRQTGTGSPAEGNFKTDNGQPTTNEQ